MTDDKFRMTGNKKKELITLCPLPMFTMISQNVSYELEVCSCISIKHIEHFSDDTGVEDAVKR